MSQNEISKLQHQDSNDSGVYVEETMKDINQTEALIPNFVS